MARIATLATVLALLSGLTAAAQDADRTAEKKSALEWVDAFSERWDESQWEKSFRGIAGFMRPLDDEDWKVRMKALQGVAGEGKEAVAVLLEALAGDDAPRRIFAAQALGYLAPGVPAAPLLKAAKSDPDAAVRLYAVEALARQGAGSVDFADLEKGESNRDVKKHLGYAREREGEPLDPAIARRLRDWDPATIASAEMGKPAPDFELKSATGETIRLSGYRGKSAVVLIFIYGDT